VVRLNHCSSTPCRDRVMPCRTEYVAPERQRVIDHLEDLRDAQMGFRDPGVFPPKRAWPLFHAKAGCALASHDALGGRSCYVSSLAGL